MMQRVVMGNPYMIAPLWRAAWYRRDTFSVPNAVRRHPAVCFK